MCQYRFDYLSFNLKVADNIANLLYEKKEDFCVFNPLKLKINKETRIKSDCSAE
jgi:hypothetical protein